MLGMASMYFIGRNLHLKRYPGLVDTREGGGARLIMQYSNAVDSTMDLLRMDFRQSSPFDHGPTKKVHVSTVSVWSCVEIHIFQRVHHIR